MTEARSLSVELEPLSSVDAGVVHEWQQLADAAVEPNPEFAPQVLLPAARWLPDGASVRLATVRQRGRLVLAMPLLSSRYQRMPVRALTTWPYSPVGAPLLAEEGLTTAPAALLAELARLRSPGWLVLDHLYLDGPVARAFRAAAADRSASWVEHDLWRRPAVRARDQETYLQDTLSAQSAKTLRRRRRNLERDHGPVVLRDAAGGADPATIQAEVEAFLTMEAAGWKGRAGTALACDPRHTGFWRESCLELGRTGRLHLWQLIAGDRVVARQCDAQFGGTLFHLKTTYDEDLSRYSPGVQLDLDLLHIFHLDPALQWLDPCTGRDPDTLAAGLYPDTRRLGDALIGLSTLGRATSQLTPIVASTWRRLKRSRLRRLPSTLSPSRSGESAASAGRGSRTGDADTSDERPA